MAPARSTRSTHSTIAAAEAAAQAQQQKELLSVIKGADRLLPPPDKLDHIRNVAKAMRSLGQEIEDAEAALAEKKARMTNLTMKELPDLFEQYNIPSLTLGAEGNSPEVELVSQPFYKAVLPKDENDVTLPAGLKWLEKNKHGDLIKRVFVVSLPMDSVKEAQALQKFLMGPKRKRNTKTSRYQFEAKSTVHHGTLTAFVREQIEKGRSGLPLEILGATVGKIVRMKATKSIGRK